MSGKGSTGNVIAALCSFFIPGLGQLIQGRVLWALIWFIIGALSYIFWFIGLPALIGILACIHAAVYKGDD